MPPMVAYEDFLPNVIAKPALAPVWCGPSNLVTFARSQPPGWRSQVAILVGDPDTDAEF